ncbi:glycosyltransferase [Candidatus Pacearchaeota archaeon]|nr:glycosyltransferase [Candidatus Pacearchaeota archaeon]
MEISVVIPVFNSEDCVDLLYDKLSKVLKKITKTWEIIFVNDSSSDNSWKKISEIKDKRVVKINLMNNFGQHNAIMCGLNYAKGKIVLTMDDDLQHPPEEIPKLIKKIKEGYLVVYGQYKEKKHGLFRDFCSKNVNKILSKITGTGYNVTSFKAIRQIVVKKLIQFKNYNIMLDVFINDLVSSKNVGHCEVKHKKRKIGKSNYTLKKLISFALNMIFNYTIWPLRFSTIIGFIVSSISLFLGLFEFIIYFTYGIDVPGWTMLFLVVTFVLGNILFILGIFGEYLGKIYLIVNKKPQFVIKEVKNGN